MLCGVIRILSRIKWWLFGPKYKFCRQFCPTCEYFDICKSDVEYVETVMGEPFE